jgi:predicted RNA binding protein with dsRBD fold (UPF0201 family)
LSGNGDAKNFLTKKESLEQELNIRQENWFNLRKQAALHGAAFVPIDLQNQIAEEEVEIENLKSQIAELEQA